VDILDDMVSKLSEKYF